MKVGDYVRTNYGIRKVKEIRIKDNYLDDGFYVEDRYIVCGHKAMQEIKSSPNIIDLIELGDLVKIEFGKDDTNIFEVVAINKNDNEIGIFNNNFEFDWASVEQLKSIVTKEQFKSMEYKVC